MKKTNDKMSWVELRKAIAKQASVSEKEAGLFLSALITSLIDSLKTDKQVKINGLGQFKLQAVAPRKSVNIATGEDIIIPGYNKPIFSMESSLKDALNGTSEPILQPNNDPIKKLGEQADEIVNILADLGQDPNAVPADAPSVEEKEVEHTDPSVVLVESEEKKVEEEIQMPQDHQHNQKKNSRPWLTVGLTVLFFCLLLIAAYFFLQHKLIEWTGTLHEKMMQTEQTVVTTPATREDNTVTYQKEAPAEDAVPVPVTDRARHYDQFITTEKMHADSRLAWMAYRYYGNKDLWVFLYEANLDHLSHPSRIVVGTPIRVPKLAPELMDMSNPETKKVVEELQHKYLR